MSHTSRDMNSCWNSDVVMSHDKAVQNYIIFFWNKWQFVLISKGAFEMVQVTPTLSFTNKDSMCMEKKKKHVESCVWINSN